MKESKSNYLFKILRKVYYLTILNILWVFMNIIGLVIFSAIPATLTVFDILIKLNEEEDLLIFKEFFLTFNKFFKRSLKYSLFIFSVLIIMFFSIYLTYNLLTNFKDLNPIFYIVSIITLILLVILFVFFLVVINQILYILIIDINIELLSGITLAIKMSVILLFKTLLSLIVFILYIIIGFLIPEIIIFLIFIGMPMIFLLNLGLLLKDYQKYFSI